MTCLVNQCTAMAAVWTWHALLSPLDKFAITRQIVVKQAPSLMSFLSLLLLWVLKARIKRLKPPRHPRWGGGQQMSQGKAQPPSELPPSSRHGSLKCWWRGRTKSQKQYEHLGWHQFQAVSQWTVSAEVGIPEGSPQPGHSHCHTQF